MKFKENKAIYLQISERICDGILLGEYEEGGRIPSVREYAAIVEVNFNTVMRSFEYLQSIDVIYNKRGIGYFVSPGAKDQIRSLRKKIFMEEDADDFFNQVYTLNIPVEDIVSMYNAYVEKQKNKE